MADALRDIDEAEATALEDDFPVPSAEMLEETRVLLHRLYVAYPYRYGVCPSGRGEMVIYAQLELGRSIIKGTLRHPVSEPGSACEEECVVPSRLQPPANR